MALQYICAFCAAPTAPKRCGGCSNTFYCNQGCQQADWTRHIFACTPRRPLTTADSLALDVRERRVPALEQTRLDWGFEKAASTVSIYAEHKLLDLYVDLIEFVGIKPAKLHTWRVANRLFAQIKAAYDVLPVETRNNEVYQWLLNHQGILENPSPNDEEKEMCMDRAYRRVWVQLGCLPTDASLEQINDFVQSLSPTARSCFRFYSLCLDDSYPPAFSDLYLKFGFGACREVPQEYNALCRSYQNLIQVASFNEFHGAYKTGRLFSLFGQKNVVILLDPSRGAPLQDILACMPDVEKLKTVWNVEQSLADVAGAIQPLTSVPMPMNAGVDYGYENCEGNSEYEGKLSSLYRSFFAHEQADPLKLHTACVQGRLFDFFDRKTGMDLGRDRALYKRLLARVAAA